MPLLRVQSAVFGYDDTDIFSNLSFEIQPGEIFCIVGPNGCGKTTLLDCLLGINKLRQGIISLNGMDINGISPRAMAKEIAYVPQAHVKTFPYTVKEIVLMGRAAYTGFFSAPSVEDEKIAEEAMAMVGMDKFQDRPYTQLSGGEGQLVMIARALAQKTHFIIMDEPTAHLDFKHELTVMETVVRLVRDIGVSIIMATHFPNHAFYFENNQINTRVAMMNERTFLRIGGPTTVLTEKNLVELYNVMAKVVTYPLQNGLVIKQVIPVSTVGNGTIEERVAL
ncbi:ABC transporter ATP-binding protein [Phosphitispora sp. TUW77]|uniref:ABC transporter ATP-binding protein n=1 Tax=Phosphitispora sp. TUW77 TaxID=3152361 RepID=UPI003AB8046B